MDAFQVLDQKEYQNNIQHLITIAINFINNITIKRLLIIKKPTTKKHLIKAFIVKHHFLIILNSNLDNHNQAFNYFFITFIIHKTFIIILINIHIFIINTRYLYNQVKLAITVFVIIKEYLVNYSFLHS